VQVIFQAIYLNNHPMHLIEVSHHPSQ